MWKLLNLISKVKDIGNTSYFCHRKTSNNRYYRNEQNKKITVCSLCVEYAKRRAFRKI